MICLYHILTGPNQGRVCRRPAKWKIDSRYAATDQRFACGHHARCWLDSVKARL